MQLSATCMTGMRELLCAMPELLKGGEERGKETGEEENEEGKAT